MLRVNSVSSVKLCMCSHAAVSEGWRWVPWPTCQGQQSRVDRWAGARVRAKHSPAAAAAAVHTEERKEDTHTHSDSWRGANQ